MVMIRERVQPWGSTKATIIQEENQPDDHRRLVEELLQPDRQLVSDIKADTDMICTIDELAQAELEVVNDMVHTDLDNDREEIETPNQQAYSEHYATKIKSIKENGIRVRSVRVLEAMLIK